MTQPGEDYGLNYAQNHDRRYLRKIMVSGIRLNFPSATSPLLLFLFPVSFLPFLHISFHSHFFMIILFPSATTQFTFATIPFVKVRQAETSGDLHI